MGTRHLTCVVMDGKYVLAKYGQWDGYPSGAGLKILDAIRKYTVKDMAERFSNMKDISDEEIQQVYRDLDISTDDGWVCLADSIKFSKARPELSRDIGGDIITYLMEHPNIMKVKNSLDFVSDSLYCEWAYVIDLDKLTFEVYRGFNITPLKEGERFFNMPLIDHELDTKYYPVSFLYSFDLNNPPDNKTFLLITDPPEAEIEEDEETN